MSGARSAIVVATLALLLSPIPATAQGSCGHEGESPCSAGSACQGGLAVWSDGQCHASPSTCGAEGQSACRQGPTCLQSLNPDPSGVCRRDSGSGANGGPGGNGCGGCFPPCPGQENGGGGGGQDATQPSLDIQQPTTSNGQGGSLIVVAGLANDITLVASNPLKARFTGTADINDQGADMNVTHFALDIPPGGKQLFRVRVVPALGQQGFGASSRIEGTAGGVDVCTQSGFGAQVVPPISIEWISPFPNSALATIESLDIHGGGGPSGAALAFGSASDVRVRATNVGNATSATVYLYARVNNVVLGASVPVEPLAPGASTVLTLGKVPPRPADCDGPVQKAGCGGGTYIQIAESPRADPPEHGGATAATIVAANGLVASTRDLSLVQVDPGSVLPLVEGAPTATLGEPYVATINVTNYGTKVDTNDPVKVLFVPPFRAQYDVQGEESTSLLVSTAPGEHVQRSALFTPLVSGRWEILVRFIPPGEICCVTHAFTVDVPGDVNVSIPSSSPSVADLGGTARTPVLVRADAAVHGATLRVTTAPEARGGREGGGDPSASAVLGGLTASLVTAEPASVPLGDLAAGASVWSNVTVTSRASGVYNVVPYVLANGFAYTGRPVVESENGIATHPDFTPQYAIAFEARHAPLVLAFAPVVVALVAGVAAFFGRRLWIK